MGELGICDALVTKTPASALSQKQDLGIPCPESGGGKKQRLRIWMRAGFQQKLFDIKYHRPGEIKNF